MSAPRFRADVVVPFAVLGSEAFKLAVQIADFTHGEGMDDWRLLHDGDEVSCSGALAELIDATFEAKGLEAFGVRRALDGQLWEGAA